MKKFTAIKWPLTETNLFTVIRELQREILKYYIVEAVIDGPTVVNHLLDRQPIGWYAVDMQDSGVIYRTAWDTRTITFNSASSISCKILIF